MSFNTSAKRKVRMKFNLPYIKKLNVLNKRKCRYFGLTGAKLNDILDWKEYIEYFLTVEYDDKKISELIHNIQSNKLESCSDFIPGDLVALILTDDVKIDFPFDIINIDLLGTLIYQNRPDIERVKRIEMFEKILKKQADTQKNGESFLFLITLNGQRGKDISIYENALKSLQNNKFAQNLMSNTSGTVKLYQKILCVLPSLLAQKCLNLYKIKDFELILYKGNTNTMVHICLLLEKHKIPINLSVPEYSFFLKKKITVIKKDGTSYEIDPESFFQPNLEISF
jgi:hypothetical protein